MLEGTRIELDAGANKPLASASLHLGDSPAPDAVVFNDRRTRFQTSFPVKDNVAFWFTLEDQEGFRNRDAVRYDVRMFKDEAPRVVIAEPKTDRDVPADAMILVRVEIDDDFGLHSSRLLYKVSAGDSEPHEDVAIPLWSSSVDESSPAEPIFVKHQQVTHEWNLAPLKLAVGSIISFHAEARDFDSIKGPNLGKSRELRLRIVSKEDAARQFDDARRELREEIARILAMQRQAITPVDEARRSLAKVDRLSRKQREDLNNAGMIQRQVGSRMSNRDEGLEQRLRRLLDDLKNFKIANPEAQQQMQDMLARLDTLRDRHVGQAEQGLTRATKNLEQLPDSPASSTPPSASPEQAPSSTQTPGQAQPARQSEPKAWPETLGRVGQECFARRTGEESAQPSGEELTSG